MRIGRPRLTISSMPSLTVDWDSICWRATSAKRRTDWKGKCSPSPLPATKSGGATPEKSYNRRRHVMRDHLLIYVNGRRHEVAGERAFQSLSSFLRYDLAL